MAFPDETSEGGPKAPGQNQAAKNNVDRGEGFIQKEGPHDDAMKQDRGSTQALHRVGVDGLSCS